MPFRPVKQISTVVRQQYFEPTISWSLRVVLALNVPLIVIPIFKGFSYEVIWAAFGAYMLSLIDYRGLHYRKILIQGLTALLVFGAALLGIAVTHSVLLSVLAMFGVGLVAALIRNWSDYGPSIAVSTGFFFLFGLATPAQFPAAFEYGVYLLAGCAWAMLITMASFPFQPSNPLRRSVAGLWKANTDLLDTIIDKLSRGDAVPATSIMEKELQVRRLIDQSRTLFAARPRSTTRMKAAHYDQMLELRKTASLFAASVSSMHEELELLNTRALQTNQDISFYKTLSAFAQASARMAVAIFTLRPEDLAMARIRVGRCDVAVELFIKAIRGLQLSEKEEDALQHFTSSLYHGLEYFNTALRQLEAKLELQKSAYFENYKLSFHDFMAGIRPNALGSLLREWLNFNSRQFRYALRVALGLALGVLVFKYFRIDHGYWIPLTMMIVIQPYYGATLKKGLERIIGTVAGIVAGGMILLLPIPHHWLVAILVLDSFFVAYFLRNNYKVGVFFVTIMMVLLMQIAQQSNWQLIGWRILSTLLGAGLALLSGYAFWPDWESDRFPQLLDNALMRNRDYLLRLLSALQSGQLPVDSWHRERRLAEGANNTAFASAQRLLEEPERARAGADNALALVGASIRISREITSMTIDLENRPPNAPFPLALFPSQLSQAFDAVAGRVRQPKLDTVKPDFAVLKQALQQQQFAAGSQAELIRTELEKLLFELEAIWVLAGRG